jgi:hypothetical protein
VELALGTVQFGLAYGIAGRGRAVPENEVRNILQEAWSRGVRTLDTAAAYGDIEQRLGRLTEGLAFRIVSKVPALPTHLSWEEAVAQALAAAQRSRARLGAALFGLMLHNHADIVGPRGEAVWGALSQWAVREEIALGASVYDPTTALTLARTPGIALAQLPGNAFDQRVVSAMPLAPPGLNIHLRSAFLQGLLVMPQDNAIARVPAASTALERWHAWCAREGKSPIVAALSIVRGFAAVSTVVVGVDNQNQLTEIADAWDAARPVRAPELAVEALDIIDPRTWKIANDSR